MGRHKKLDLTLSKRLDSIMQQRRLYPSDVSRLTGIKVRMIHNYISGTCQPSAFMVKKLAEGLNVSADYLLGVGEQ